MSHASLYKAYKRSYNNKISQYFSPIIFFCYRKQPKSFAFDHCFYSADPIREDYASQEVVFDCLGRDILDNAFQGYNACIFAYGQTGKLIFFAKMGCKI